MMKYLWLAFCLFLPLAAQAETIKIEKGACDLVTRHQPTPDVEYQPGVDAYGRPIAPADLNPSLTLPPVITIPLTLDLASGLGLPMGKLTGTEATVGVIRVEGNKAYFNGQPLQPEFEDNLAILCMKANADTGRKAGNIR